MQTFLTVHGMGRGAADGTTGESDEYVPER
jgi:hypothetical protein